MKLHFSPLTFNLSPILNLRSSRYFVLACAAGLAGLTLSPLQAQKPVTQDAVDPEVTSAPEAPEAAKATPAQPPQMQSLRNAADTMPPVPFPAEGIPITLTRPAGAAVTAWPLRTGVPLAPGMLKRGESVRLFAGEREIPVQTEVMATWGPEGSTASQYVKWLGLDFVESLGADQLASFRLVKADAKDGAPSAMPAKPLTVEETPSSITINTGKMDLVINRPGTSKTGFNIFDSVTVNGKPVWKPGGAQGAFIVSGNGTKYLASNDAGATVIVESQGPLAAVIRAEGWFINPDSKHLGNTGEPKERPPGAFCRWVTRIYVAAGQTDVRVQHTFILTEDTEKSTFRDIGLILPTGPSQAARYGGVENVIEEASYLLQDSWDSFSVRRTKDGEKLLEGQKAEGWVVSGDLGVGVREFWENFPKELEADPAKGEVIVHFWPGHGAPRMETPETMNDANAWRLPFVHSGKELDFRIPKCLEDEKKFPALNAEQYVPNMMKANAMGIAKTHDVLLSFSPDGFKERMVAFRSAPHPLASPAFIAATGAFGNIPEADPKKRALIEHRYAASMKFLIRSREHANSYGMWNFGDLHTYLQIKDGFGWPGYNRLWAGPHYNYPRVAWWLYWRTGDPDFLDHAKAETSHIGDVDTSHWTDAYFSGPETSASITRKAVGGLCDYKGVVHWNAGDRTDYNAAVDYYLYDYYLTGNRRAWDVAMEHGYYTVSKNMKSTTREGSGPTDTIIELYKATWDPVVGAKVLEQANKIMRNPVTNGLDWTPWALRLWELTHDPALKEFVLNWVGSDANRRITMIALAYAMTGDKAYADQCARFIFDRAATTVVREDSLDGAVDREMIKWAFDLTDGMLILNAAEAGTVKLVDLQEGTDFKGQARIGYGMEVPYTVNKSLAEIHFGGTYPWPDADGFQQTSYIYHDGSPKDVWLGIQQMPALPGAIVTLYRPDGSESKSVDLKNYSSLSASLNVALESGDKSGSLYAVKALSPQTFYPIADGKIVVDGKTYPYKEGIILASEKLVSPETLFALGGEKVSLGESDPKGFYKVVHRGTYYRPLPVSTKESKAWIEAGKASTVEINGAVFFYVPKDCEEFEISFLPTYTPERFYNKLRMATGVIVDPDCKIAAEASCGLENRPQTVRVKVKPEHRGKAWAISGQLLAISEMKNIPPYIAQNLSAFEGSPEVPQQ